MRDIFSTGRYEHNRPYRHIFYVPNELYHRLLLPKPVYLVGGRGSGKTTLLKILDWRERIYNDHLSKSLSGRPFQDKILGIYLKLPEHQLTSFDHWLRSFDSDQGAVIFGVYFDLLWMQDAVQALAELMSRGYLSGNPSDEVDILSKLKVDSKFTFLKFSSDNSLLALATLLEEARGRLQHMALLRTSMDEFLSVFPAVEPGELGRRLSSYLCGEPTESERSEWRIKVCFDEAEILSARQQLYINSATRLTKSPLSYVFSYVCRDHDLTTTIYENLSVNLADCEPINLDTSSDNDFQLLVEGVATARAKALIRDWSANISLKSIFGPTDLNRFLHSHIKGSVSANAKSLLECSINLSKKAFYNELEGDNTNENAPPIYQAYLIEKGVANLPDPQAELWEKRRQESREQRKKMVAAYLSICHEFDFQPIYAGINAAIGAADGSVRDMLFQLDQLFIRCNRDLVHLCNQGLDPKQQSDALREASRLKLMALPEWVRIPHQTVRVLIDVLGNLTRILQTEGLKNSHLRSTERGRFQIEESLYTSPHFSCHREILEEAIYAGYICEFEKKDRYRSFRIHRSLSPYYNFSYRGPYYGNRLVLNDFERISNTSTNSEAQEIARQIACRIEGNEDSTMPLFPEYP